MFKIRIKGRLGNQLFIYAFARELVHKYSTPVLIYDRERHSNWISHLNNYNTNKNIIFTSNRKAVMKMNIKAKAWFIYSKLCTKNMTPRERHTFEIDHLKKLEKEGLFLLTDGYAELPTVIKKDTFFDGYFQSPKYFNTIRKDLLKELVPKTKYNHEELQFLNLIENSESVCVSIRLGDYLNNSTHQVCTKDYYLKAMKKIKQLYPNCKFFIFSDEVKKAEKIFQFEYPVIYDSGKMKDYISLSIMSKCKHFIISNSSFSWWAQYLSTNVNKTVIAPNKWFAKDVPCDIFEDNWIKLKVN